MMEVTCAELKASEFLKRDHDPLLLCGDSGLLDKFERLSKQFLSLSVSDDNWRSCPDISITETFFQTGEKYLDCLINLEHNEETCCSSKHHRVLLTATTLLKLIRNSLSGNDCNFVKVSRFCTTLSKVLNNYLKDSRICEGHIDENLLLLRCSMQVIVNFASSSKCNSKKMSELFCRDLVRIIIGQTDDRKLVDYATAALHSSLIHSEDALMDLHLCSPTCDVNLLTRELLSALVRPDPDDEKEIHPEWSLFVFKVLLKSRKYLETVWPSLSDQERLFAVEVLDEESDRLASEALQDSKSILSFCHWSNIDYLCSRLTNQIDSVIQGHGHVIDKMILLQPLLHLINKVSPHFHLLMEMENSCLLLNRSIDILRILQSAATARGNDLNKNEKISLAEARRDLVRLIANLVYKNKMHQNMSRENGGLNLLLNMTTIDANCPSTQQWALFAISNLCEDNEENRRYISSLKLERVADVSEELRSAGVKVEVRNAKLHFLKPDD